MKEYHVDLGDNYNGPIGVTATSPAQAVSLLRSVLPESIDLPDALPEIGYITSYLNPAKIAAFEIDDVTPCS